MKKTPWTAVYRWSAFLLSVLLLLPLCLSACDADTPEEEIRPADYGRIGSELALALARNHPLRSAGSNQERLAGDWIIGVLEENGYQPEVTSFVFEKRDGSLGTSRNIAIRIPGKGFIREQEEGQDKEEEAFRRQVIVGAHYDAYFSETDLLPTEPDQPDEDPDSDAEADPVQAAQAMGQPPLNVFDGIHDNASGIGCLLLLARELRGQSLGYDVILVAFGAGEAGQAGARAYAREMTTQEIDATDAMYCIDSIYAGDKVYAHAGHNSVRGYNRKHYEKRRKLYEVTDVYYEHQLYTNNQFMLYTNQSALNLSLDDLSAPVLYREWTLTESDYRPFDDLGIPIVFFESYDYDATTLEGQKESKNPAFAATEGAIRRTSFDNTVFLRQLMNQQRSSVSKQNDTNRTVRLEDHLTRRINNTAFIVLEAIKKGVHDAHVAEPTHAPTQEAADH